MAKLKRKKSVNTVGKLDITFLSFVLILLTVGLVMLYSSSYAFSYNQYGSSYKFISRQAMFAAVGVVVMLAVSRIDYHFWRRFAWILYAASTAMLALLLVLPPMVEGKDVKRWIVMGPINFQPSEVAKFAVILLFSSLIAANYKQMKSFKFIAFLVALLGLQCVLVVMEPHLSATVLIFAIGIVLLIVGGLPKRYILGGVGAGVGLGVLAVVTGVIGYGSDRIKYWLDPWADAMGKGFQTIQSLLAIGSGGILGRGIGQSRQK